MRIRAAVIGAAIVAAGASPAGAQRSLGELGGPIDLDAPRATSDGMVIDQYIVAAAPTPIPSNAGERLRAEVEDARGLVAELLRHTDPMDSWDPYFDPQWKRRFLDLGLELELARERLRLLDVPSELDDLRQQAMEAVTALTDRMAPLEAGLRSGDPPQMTVIRAARSARDRLAGVPTEIGRRARRLNRTSAPPPIDPFQAQQGIENLCARRTGGDSVDRRLCLRRQREAMTALTGRMAYQLGVGEDEFNRIRWECQEEFPIDLEGRDSCERMRSAAVRTSNGNR